MIIKSAVKKKLRKREMVTEVMQRLPDPSITEMLARNGVDLIVIDMEHFGFNEETLLNIVRAAQANGVETITRPISNDPILIGKLLDLGIGGIMAPQIESYDEAMRVLSAMRYAPEGDRGFTSMSRAAHYGMDLTAKEYVNLVNRNLIFMVIIESKEGVEALPQLLTIDDIDSFHIGTSDLSHSYGYPNQADHPVIQEVISDVVEQILAAGKSLCGTAYGSDLRMRVKLAQSELAAGKNDLLLGSDVQCLMHVFKDMIDCLR